MHVIFSTKDRALLIHEPKEKAIHQEIRRELEEMGCSVKNINGMPDHVHALFLLNKQKGISDVLKQLKGGSSHTINEASMIREKFAWQTGYAAFAVSESQVEKVDRYISNQKEHHKIKTFIEEYNEFLAAHGLLHESSDL